MSCPDGDDEVEKLVQLARLRNEPRGVTGALVYTGTYFAQVIEAPHFAVADLMAILFRDTRHEDVRVIERHQIQERRFEDWSMAYSGPSFYVNRFIKPLLDDWETGEAKSARADRLIGLMREFSAVA